MPSPSAPIRFAAGIRTSVNETIGWWWLNVCVYAGVRTTATPGLGRSTRNMACSPWCSPPSSVAWKNAKSAVLYEVTCHLTPFSR